jgi:hypothetical protein
MLKTVALLSVLLFCGQTFSQANHQEEHIAYYPALVNDKNICLMQRPIKVANALYSYHYLISGLTLEVLRNDLSIVEPLNYLEWLESGARVERRSMIDNAIVVGTDIVSPLELLPPKGVDNSAGEGRVLGFYNTNNDDADFDNEPPMVGDLNKKCAWWKSSVGGDSTYNCGGIVLDFAKISATESLSDQEVLNRALIAMYTTLRSAINTRVGKTGAFFKIKNLRPGQELVSVDGLDLHIGYVTNSKGKANFGQSTLAFTSADLEDGGRLQVLGEYLYNNGVLKRDCTSQLELYDDEEPMI